MDQLTKPTRAKKKIHDFSKPTVMAIGYFVKGKKVTKQEYYKHLHGKS